MTYFARSIFRQFFDSLTSSEKNNLQNLLDIAQNRHKGYTLTPVQDHRVWVVNSPECRSLLEKLVSAHLDPANLGWDNIGDVHVDSYWKIAKLYMPHGNKDSTCPADTDMLAMFTLLRNFIVEDFVEERIEIDQMICHSKYLIIHSDDNRISRAKMTEILENINKFMESTKLGYVIKLLTKDKLKQVQLISKSDKWYLYEIVLSKDKTVLEVQLDRTELFWIITRRLLLVFETEYAYDMGRGMFSGALAGAATGASLGPVGLVIGGVSGAAIGALLGLFRR
ncbi:uncharacterized protein LOC132731747 [Ruditapes philippinarum]|uniref:uncharacterized protein LOC132731747 n=1 Tax=Ruditapes philippinarum TaxID=129788 RepID=UPI00295AEB24|nr:uncharacterized protein LOC132731747 [Ruditapes philippinarum]